VPVRVCHYLEQWPESEWAGDAQLVAELTLEPYDVAVLEAGV
jgi:hypothetical protein